MNSKSKLFNPHYVSEVMSQMDYLKEFFERSPIPESEVYKAIDMSRQTWKRRLKSKDFTVKEMSKIVVFLDKKIGH